MRWIDAPDLAERSDGFSYDYRMRCDCGGTAPVTAQDYWDQINDCHTRCGRCGADVHFGPAVASIRDPKDPALSDEMVGRLAWYHTSTWPDWPSPNHRASVVESFDRVDIRRRFGDVDAAIERQATKALHLGTYEAAVENMLRRMHDQADEVSQFFLYRVAVRAAPGRINSGYRDENLEDASQIGVADLDVAGLDVVRYLNVREAMGTLSIAVRPSAIVAVQSLPIPIRDLSQPRSANLESRLAQLDVEFAELERIEAAERRRWALGSVLDDLLIEHRLKGISPVVADEARQAVRAWHSAVSDKAVSTYAAMFDAIASLLTEPEAVIALVASQPWRNVDGTPPE